MAMGFPKESGVSRDSRDLSILLRQEYILHGRTSEILCPSARVVSRVALLGKLENKENMLEVRQPWLFYSSYHGFSS